MRITAIDTLPVRVPLTEPVKWSGGTRTTAPGVIVQIHTDAGLVGLGECNGPTLPTIKTVLDEELKPILLGADPRRIEFLLHKMDEHIVNYDEIGRYAIAGVDLALHDLLGKSLGCRVCDLLGGVYRECVTFNGYMFIDTPERNAATAQAFVARGASTLKMKVGRDPDLDVERVRAVRQAVGDDVRIRVDANMAWSEATAIAVLRRMAPVGIEFCEQPLPWYDIEGMARVRQAAGVPIAADEGLTGIRSALALIQARAVDVFVLYVSEAGGLSHARDIVRLADAAGVQCVLGTWAELGIGTVAGMHLAAASRNFQLACDTHYLLLEDDILTARLPFEGHLAALPAGPGLGVTLDEAKVATYGRYEARETVFGDADDPRWIPRIGMLQPLRPQG